MKILFDQGVPVPLRRLLPNHQVDTAYECGWAAVNDGELLNLAQEHQYQLLITTDQNLKHQQNLANRPLAVLVLLSTAWPRIERQATKIAATVQTISGGEYIELAI